MKKAAIGALLILQIGCGTMASGIEGNIGPYSGVKQGFRQAAYHKKHHDSFAELICLLDFPASFLLDTMLLPFTIIKP